jgi:hypothetical protein
VVRILMVPTLQEHLATATQYVQMESHGVKLIIIVTFNAYIAAEL